MDNPQGTLFDKRFLVEYSGQIMRDPKTALVELVANAWDAYATDVKIFWPDNNSPFRITDNGIGMTPQEFELRWRTLSYNRLLNQGEYTAPPPDSSLTASRKAFGRNGKGRLAGFLFSSPFHVRTWRDGVEVTYEVFRSVTGASPFDTKEVNRLNNVEGHGCEIIGLEHMQPGFDADTAREILSTRFLTNPDFRVTINGVPVTFQDIPVDCKKEMDVDVPGYGKTRLLVIDSQVTDRTSKQHGIAWRVQGRLVGECDWRWIDNEIVLDGRTAEAKRYTFIIFADFLGDKENNAVEADWSGFRTDSIAWAETNRVLQEKILEIVKGITKEKRAKTRESVRDSNRFTLKKMTTLSRERWLHFLDDIVDSCPGLTETQISQVMTLLTNMEMAKSQYSLLDKLHKLSPKDIDEWDSVLEFWSVETAKAALDEIEKRLRLIEEIRAKSERSDTDEVGELQPLFEQGLWVFGPQFESIEFTSNRGMTNVIKSLFKVNDTGSRNRPDFAVLPDSTVGFYSLPAFDEQFNEAGTRTLVIVELKRPGVPISTEEKNQVWKYVKELIQKGYVTPETQVFGYVLGDTIDAAESGETTQYSGRVKIRPLHYSSFVSQAEKRMFNLQRKLKDAPFMVDVLQDLYSEEDQEQDEMLLQNA